MIISEDISPDNPAPSSSIPTPTPPNGAPSPTPPRPWSTPAPWASTSTTYPDPLSTGGVWHLTQRLSLTANTFVIY